MGVELVDKHAPGNELDLVHPVIHAHQGSVEQFANQVRPIDGDFVGKDIVSIDQFTKADIDIVMDEAMEMALAVLRQGRTDILADKVLANLFYEPSTRTYLSFEAAAVRLGAGTINTQGVEYSSIAKGETLEDTVRTVERYADLITLRHKDIGAAAIAAANTGIPVINGGDGVGEHPTQALLDWFTLREEAIRSPEEGLRITMLGDLKNGRTVHSLARLASLHPSTTLNYVAPDALQMPAELVGRLDQLGITQRQTTDLHEVLRETDVLYATRIQKERFGSETEYLCYKGAYTVDHTVMNYAPRDMILMHPLPRVGEIASEVDADPRAVYFDQVENGMYVRMALQALVFGRGFTQ